MGEGTWKWEDSLGTTTAIHVTYRQGSPPQAASADGFLCLCVFEYATGVHADTERTVDVTTTAMSLQTNL